MSRRSARLAGSTAVRTSPAANLESPKTNLAIVKHEKKGIDSKGGDQSPVRPQKRSKLSKPNVSSLHPSLQLKNVRGRRGALKDIVEMPLDILHEIFMYLTPVEVLSLSRMCKALRRILITKSAEYVWKQARLNFDDFPNRPDDLNEVQYASLIFDSLCDYCNCKTKGRFYIWSARRRGCSTCITSKHKHGLFRPKKGLIRVYNFLGASEYPAIVPVLPSISWRSKTETLPVNDDHSICVVSANQILKEFKELGKSDSRAQEAWIQKHKDERQRRIAHGRLCERWLENQDHERVAEHERLCKRRYEAIKQRLTDLDLDEDFAKMPDVRRWPSVNQPKELTDRVWQNIKDDIVEKLKRHRNLRPEEAHSAAKKRRWRRLLNCVNDLRRKNGDKMIFPRVFEIESSGRISALLEAPTEEVVEFPESMVLEAVQGWRQHCETRLRNIVIAGTTSTSQPSGVDPLSLATTFFSCWRLCHLCRVLQYPRVLRHACATLAASYNTCRWNEDNQRIFFAAETYSLAKAILEVVGFNPDTTTTEDVQWPALILECHACSSSNGRSLMSWPLAVQDALQHSRCGEHVRMARADLSDAELERAEELARSNNYERYREGLISCVLDLDAAGAACA